ncbi:MAG: hypothetical protein ACLFUQ_01840, partial [Candidatus Izemoplasmataceae bacterium]
MSKRDPKKGTLNLQSGYSIEKAYRKEAEPHQKKLDALRKEYEETLAATEKALEKAQKSYQKRLDAHERRFTSELESREASFDSEITGLDTALKDKVKAFKDAIHALQQDYQEKRATAKKTIDRLETDKKKKTESIEEAHKKTIETYEKTLELSRKNHQENTRKTKATLEEALDQLNARHQEQKEALSTLKSDLDGHFNKLSEDLSALEHKADASIKKEDNELQYTLNTYRKEINQRIKDFSRTLQQYRVAFHEPFSAIDALSGTLKESYDAYKASFISKVNQDMKFEQARLKDLLKNPDLQDDAQALNEINQQIDLQHARKETLIRHATTLGTGITQTTEAIKALSKTAREHLDTSFQAYEASIEESQTMLKHKFDIFQNTSQSIVDKLIGGEDDPDALTPFLKEAHRVFEKALRTYLEHGIQKTEAIREAYAALMPLFEESDELRFYLDTEDAQKKIRINREKISVEQKDASLNIEREQTKQKHTMETLDIDYHYDAKKAFLKAQAEWLAFRHKKAMLEAKKNAKKADLEVEREIERATLDHDLEAVKNAVENEHLEKAETLQVAIEKQKHALRVVDAKKKRDLSLRELKGETERKERTVELELEQNKQNLERVRKVLDEKEQAIEAVYQKKIQTLEKRFKEKQEKTLQSLKKLRTAHEERHRFIEQALKRETEKADQAIKETDRMKTLRIQAIDKAMDQVFAPLKNHADALEDEDASLNAVVRILSTPMLESFKHAQRQAADTVEETQDLVLGQYRKLLSNHDVPEKKIKQRTTKLKTAFKKDLGLLKDQQKQNEKSIEKTSKDILATIRSADKIYMSGLKHHLKPLNTEMKATLTNQKNASVKALEDAFSSLHEDDHALIRKARDSAQKAKTEEDQRFEEAKAPLNGQLESINTERQEALAELSDQKEAELNALHASFEDDIKPLQEAYDKEREKLNTINHDYEEKEDAIEKTLEDDLLELEATLNDRLESIRTLHETKRERIQSRLNDAKNIRSYHVQNEEARKIDNEEALKKREADLETRYEASKVSVEQWIAHADKERENAKERRRKA